MIRGMERRKDEDGKENTMSERPRKKMPERRERQQKKRVKKQSRRRRLVGWG